MRMEKRWYFHSGQFWCRTNRISQGKWDLDNFSRTSSSASFAWPDYFSVKPEAMFADCWIIVENISHVSRNKPLCYRKWPRFSDFQAWNHHSKRLIETCGQLCVKHSIGWLNGDRQPHHQHDHHHFKFRNFTELRDFGVPFPVWLMMFMKYSG